MDQGTCYINTRVLQEKVFKSLFDKTVSVTEVDLIRKGYSVTRGSRPPTINIKIVSDLPFPIDVDFVPGLHLGDETVLVSQSATMHPASITVNFPRFGIMKWINKENLCIREKDKDIIWRNCSSSYERYMFDICLGERYRLYFVLVLLFWIFWVFASRFLLTLTMTPTVYMGELFSHENVQVYKVMFVLRVMQLHFVRVVLFCKSCKCILYQQSCFRFS